MTTFNGTEYRSHTVCPVNPILTQKAPQPCSALLMLHARQLTYLLQSCMTEDQKYQGALYRPKASKNSNRKSVSIVEPGDAKALVPRPAYVEDAPDNEAPPHVPTPPPAVPALTADSVFDYMVDESMPNTPQIAYAKDKGEMAMAKGAPSIFTHSRPGSSNGYRHHEEQMLNQDYLENGYTWGTVPVQSKQVLDMNGSSLTLEFMTPAAKEVKARLDKKDRPRSHSRTDSGSGQKRKRDEQQTPADSLMVDTTKADTPTIVHSGLTGGLNRMMSEENYPFRRTPETEEKNKLVIEKNRPIRRSHKTEDPISPLKRTRHAKDDSNGLGISMKGRAAKALSMVGVALLAGSGNSQQVKTRRRASSSDHGQNVTRVREGEKRERKKHKVHRHNGTASGNVRHEHRSRRHGSEDSPSHSPNEGAPRRLKAIEYRKHDDSGSETDSDPANRHGNGQGSRRKSANGAMVVFGEEERQIRACRNFLANAPGLDSEKGYSLHKMLKRWHKQTDTRSSSAKADEEEQLWRGLRIKRNEKGEFVLTF